jgi:beta-carotene/zeaxanthin 4-ketolase
MAWLATLLVGLMAIGSQSLGLLDTGWLVLLVLLRSVLQTGLFIVGHDAMHRLLVPSAPLLNDRCGAAVLALYAALPYQRCRHQHGLHHRDPGGPCDPDVHRAGASSLPAWYGQFMARYLSWGQMALLLSGWGLLAWASSIPAVLLMCTLPLLLSSLQLFVVGTYLPHRAQRPAGSFPEVISLNLPEWLSLLACFHFGYHLEHHQCPDLAWHQLPRQRRLVRAVALATAVRTQ